MSKDEFKARFRTARLVWKKVQRELGIVGYIRNRKKVGVYDMIECDLDMNCIISNAISNDYELKFISDVRARLERWSEKSLYSMYSIPTRNKNGTLQNLYFYKIHVTEKECFKRRDDTRAEAKIRNEKEKER